MSATVRGAGPGRLEPQSAAPSVVPTPIQDDANLYDLRFVGSKIGWAVGDHGVIWHTTDGGRNWQLVPSPVRCPLRSVCFLTDRVGWIVGGGTVPYTRVGYGVVLFTDDAGRSWQQLARNELPQLHYVKFFGMQRGVAVGAADGDHPTGVFSTQDGGKSWLSIPGKRNSGWRAADFLSPQVGVVAGASGRVSLVGGGRLLQPRMEQLGLRGLRRVELAPNEIGWMVGDGGLVLRTENGGVVWQPPPTPLPRELRDFVDFRAVAARGRMAWIGGQPGSVIWHTPDGGRTWSKQFTRQSVPINAITFTSETNGWAVGALGTLLWTGDGGQTWKPIRGAGRRVALLALHGRPESVSFHLLAKQSRELGYRSLVLLPTRRDIGPDGHASAGAGNGIDLDIRLHEAVITAGGSAGEIDWRFPISIPGLEQNAERLIADWRRRTEGQLDKVFLGKLVCQLRTWRPSVVVIDQPSPDDATTTLLADALMRAVHQAGDPTRFIQHRELAALEPWQVKKVYQRLPPGSTGQTHVDLHSYLPRVGTSVQVASAEAYGRLVSVPPQTSRREAYRLIAETTQQPDGNTAADFFIGIPLAPGSAARRQLAKFDDQQDALRRKIVERQRNFRAYAERYLDDPRHSAQLIAQLNQITRGMPDAQAALELSQLASDYRRRSKWDLVEATALELVDRYPDQPAAHDAMRWLLQLWTGAEPAWQRVRKVQVGRQRLTVNADAVRNRVQQAVSRARSGPRDGEGAASSLGPDPLRLVSHTGRIKTDKHTEWRSGVVRHWHEQAARMASLIRIKAPALYRTPEIRFPLASLSRQRGAFTLADSFYRHYEQAGAGDPWKKTAASELWLSNPISLPPKNVLSCRTASERPVLDGVLSDLCWQNANAIRLRTANDDEADDATLPLAMLAYDAEYLYFAVSVPRVAGTPNDRPVPAGRTHDADLSKFDRVSLYLDVDRDYATYYALHVDQRGWTADACWEDVSWNPQWYVAVDADAAHWRIEAAIPMKELVPATPRRKSVWAVGIVRTVPAVGLWSWTLPAASRPRPESFGLVRFD